MKILYIIDKVNIGGATDYMLFLALENSIENIVQVACEKNTRHDQSIPDKLSIKIINGISLYELYFDQNFEMIHWFKSESTGLFDVFCSQLRKHQKVVPIITTICQSPKDFELRITPNEIRYSQQFVFIDKYTYNSKRIPKILDCKKRMIYFGTNIPSIQNQANASKSSKEFIYFGRGSSINKCHPKFIQWFHDIPIKNKKFCIVGIENNEWLNSEISKYGIINEVEIIPHLSYEKWLNKVNSFDIFLYQLPKSAFSSIDGTMQHAMIYAKPIVYYGPEPPKELIIHGVSGFIAENKTEFIKYATLLANDEELRLKMGKNARERIIQNFNWHTTIINYTIAYSELLKITPKVNKISRYYLFDYYLSYMIFFNRKFISSFFSKSLKKKIKNWIGK